MDNNDRIYYEVPRGFDIDNFRRIVERSLLESQGEIAAVLSKYDLPSDQSSTLAKTITTSIPEIDYQGSGSIGAVVSVVVSLAPIIGPLLQPFAKRGADLAYEVAHDIWSMLKRKMLHNNIRLTERKSNNRDNS